MADYEITSGSNPRIKRLAALGSRRHRESEGVFLVEGVHLLTQALAAGLHPHEVFIDGSVDVPFPEVTLVHPQVLDRVSYRARSQGVVAVFPFFDTGLALITPGEPALLAVTEGIEKPGNLGAMLRTVDAAGGDGLIVLGGGVDPFNPNVLRASTGAVFHVPLALTELEQMGTWLEEREIVLIGADPGASTPLWEVDLRRSVALLFGAEDVGLSQAAREAVNSSFSLPMRGAVDSLNVSVSLALGLFEAVRQRLR